MRILSLPRLTVAYVSVSLIAGCGKGTGTAIPQPPVAAPGTLTFTAARGTQSAVQSISVASSNGDAITSKLAAGNQFAISGTGSCSQGSPACQIGVVFEPTATGIQRPVGLDRCRNRTQSLCTAHRASSLRSANGISRESELRERGDWPHEQRAIGDYRRAIS